ncbi:hypothetical protein OMP40_10680 [Cohnella rhizosphaerae]|uniref:Uncharacterized protein n=1 Tax=Cohnella rhizosphaerae TaxID=1457232 RepID=A0A9X4KRY4_9BACL|nr:hypothetical protein [Cohnella rhizosphaerae]MDG0809750.1 hypothetical protein [Cohnella rhizosphaerae]
MMICRAGSFSIDVISSTISVLSVRPLSVTHSCSSGPLLPVMARLCMRSRTLSWSSGSRYSKMDDPSSSAGSVASNIRSPASFTNTHLSFLKMAIVSSEFSTSSLYRSSI